MLSNRTTSNENENATMRAKGIDVAQKTPASSKSSTTRRAFGDISNQHKKEGGIAATAKSVSFAVAPKTSSSKPLVLTKTPFRISSSSSNNNNKSSAFKQRRVDFNIPKETTTARVDATNNENLNDVALNTTTTTMNNSRVTACEDSWYVEEPEQPFGRTYAEQLALQDNDDDDDSISLDGARTQRQDMIAYSQQRRERFLQLGEEEVKQQLLEFEVEIRELDDMQLRQFEVELRDFDGMMHHQTTPTLSESSNAAHAPPSHELAGFPGFLDSFNLLSVGEDDADDSWDDESVSHYPLVDISFG